MKIVHDIESLKLEAGGPVRAVLDLCRILAQAGHEVVLLTNYVTADSPKDWDGKDPRKPRIEVVPKPALPLKFYSGEQMKRIGKVLEGATVLHTHCIWDPRNAQMAALARKMGIPYVLSTRGMLDEYCVGQKAVKKKVYLTLVGNRFLRHASAVHCTADEELRQSKVFFAERQGVVIPNLVDLEPFTRLPGPSEALAKFPFLRGGPARVLFLGRLHPIKGIERLICAAGELRKQGRPVTVVLAGPGEEPYMAELRKLAAAQGVEQDVKFAGMVSGTMKNSLVQACGLFVLPSHHENFGIVLIEALACGTPVVTTHGVKIWAELERSGGAVITETDPATLAGAIGGLLADPARLKSMGEKGRAWVFDFLDPTRVRERFEKMYAMR